MARTLTSNNLVSLPILDANSALALANSLEAATKDENGKARKLPESPASALAEVREDRDALQAELAGGQPTTTADVTEADEDEDVACRALHDILAGWAHLAGRTPEGDMGLELREAIFGDTGLTFVNLRVKEEWAVVDTKLERIDESGLEEKIEQLGAGPALANLREVHRRYGEVTGATKAAVVAEPSLVKEKRIALLESIRHYVAAVAGSVQRKKPETRTLADALLQPLAAWQSKPQKRKAKPAPAPAKPAKPVDA